MSQSNSIAFNAIAVQTAQPEAGTRLGYIDGLRAAACLAVFSHHCWLYAGEPEWRISLPRGHSLNLLRVCQYGDTGVHLFLLLSGYCLFRSLARPGGWEQFHLATFARQRAWRILPAYYASCILLLLLPTLLKPFAGATGHGFHFAPAPDGLSVLLHALLLHGFYAPVLYDLNGAFWSLSLEWQFYFTFPLLAWGFHRRGPWLTLALVGGVNLAYRFAVARWLLSANTTANFTWCSLFAGRWLEFGLGMLAAWQAARQTAEPWSRRRVAATAIVALACLLAGSRAAAFSPISDIWWGVTYYCLLVLVVRRASLLQSVLSVRPLVWLGTISYSVYLLHMPLLGVVADLLPRNGVGNVNIAPLALCGALISLPLAALFYRWFERPFLKRGRKTRDAQQLSSAGATSR